MPELSAALAVYVYTLAFILGLCMGSFLNCFAYRYSKQESVIKGRSKCALCGHSLGAAELVPVFSWLFLKGKCRFCGGRISPRYILAELICALAYVSVLLKHDPLFDTLNAVKYLVLASLLFAAAFADLHGGLIPDRLIITGAVCAFLSACFPSGDFPMSLLWTLIDGLSVALPLLLLVLIFDKLMKKETMGGGDIKLMFLIGLYFDWKLNIIILIAACVLGIVFAAIKKPSGEKHGQAGAFSFAPALALAAWLVMLCGTELLDWYLGLFTL